MNTEDKNTENKNEHNKQNDQTDWKLKINGILNTCQSELKKTTKIGMKMLSASQSNAQLHESYEEIGKWLLSEVANGNIKVDDVRIEGLIAKVQELETQLQDFEQDVQDIKRE